MSGLRVCVSSGYAMEGSRNFEAEALVYTAGGRVVARFFASQAKACETARRKADYWIAADERERRKCERAETLASDPRWHFWQRRGVV